MKKTKSLLRRFLFVIPFLLVLLLGLPGDLLGNSISTNKLDSLKLEIEVSIENSEKINLLILASEQCRKQYLQEEATVYANKALSIAKAKNKIRLQVKAILELANINNDFNNINEALKFASFAKVLANENGFEKEFCDASLLLSNLFFILGEYDKSVELSFNIQRSFEQNNNNEGLCQVYDLLGRNYSVMGKDSLGRDYFQKAIKLTKLHNFKEMQGCIIINLANNYGNNGHYIEAISLLKQGSNLLKSSSINTAIEGNAYINIAMYSFEIDQQDSTLYYLDIAEKYNQKIKNKRNLAGSHRAYAYFYLKTGDEKNFLKHVYLSYSISKSNHFKFQEFQVAKMLEDYYTSIEQFDSAYYYQSIVYNINNEINSQNTLAKLTQFELAKEAEIAAEKQLLENKRKAFINKIIYLIFALILIMLVGFLYHFKIRFRYSKLKEENLQDQVSFKNKEMTIHLMDLTKRNELISDIIKDLIKVSDSAQKEEIKNSINKIALDLEKVTEIKMWEEFILRFKEVHSVFYENLITKYPDLTPNEQRLCAFLKLNLSTKEILSMTGQSERAIVMARHRLRKKLGIESQDVNLITFMSKI
jgi:DNA-binding CsgD family transcriptional regulator